MNVALTRAKHFLFVIARCQSVVVNPYWNDLVQHARETNAVLRVPKLHTHGGMQQQQFAPPLQWKLEGASGESQLQPRLPPPPPPPPPLTDAGRNSSEPPPPGRRDPRKGGNRTAPPPPDPRNAPTHRSPMKMEGPPLSDPRKVASAHSETEVDAIPTARSYTETQPLPPCNMINAKPVDPRLQQQQKRKGKDCSTSNIVKKARQG